MWRKLAIVIYGTSRIFLAETNKQLITSANCNKANNKNKVCVECFKMSSRNRFQR